jgi:hypothetical protein
VTVLIALLRATMLLTSAARPATPPDPCATVPAGLQVAVYVRAHRFFAAWPLQRGGALHFYLDTGGGTNMLLAETVRRLALTPDTTIMGGDTVTSVRVARSLGTSLFPALTDALPNPDSATVRLYVPSLTGEGGMLLRGFQLDSLTVDGFLGQRWFADRVWTFDYPGRRLFFHGSEPVTSIPTQCWVPLGFQTDSAGHRTFNFPRITAVVDGDSLDFLFDTGAMTTLTDSAWRLVDPQEPQHRATSFITRERFERWQARHPDWPVVQHAEEGFGSPMIRVPQIDVGGRHLGPVWFTQRPDQNFHEFMSQMMDRRIDGALGGSAWRSVAIVVDYPRARAAVLQPPAR